MTVLVAWEREGETWLAGDSRMLDGGWIVPTVAKKWLFFRHLACWVGLAGAVGARRLVVEALAPLPESDEPAAIQGLVGHLYTQLYDRGALNSNGDGNNAVWVAPFESLWVRPGEIWLVDSSLAPDLVIPGEPAAIGSGGNLALGVCHALGADPSLSTAYILQRALEIAAAHDPGCGPPFTVHRIEVPGEEPSAEGEEP